MPEPLLTLRPGPAVLALVDAALHRPGGWTKPIWVYCRGHDSGGRLQLRHDSGVVTLRAMRGVTLEESAEEGWFWVLACEGCGAVPALPLGAVWELSVRGLASWLQRGRTGRVGVPWA